MLISFEGIDGSGKSTQALRLKQRLEDAGRQVLLVREPGGTALSERVRQVLLDPALHVDPLAELLLFSAARAQLVRECIMPALADKQVVVCDRFFDSTTVYQGAGRGLDQDGWIAAFNRRVTSGLVPARTYLVDLDPEEAAARQMARDGQAGRDRMERASGEFYQRVVTAYRRLAAEEPARWVVIDGRLSIEAIHDIIWSDFVTLAAARNTPEQ
ncbi:MAG: dTMP kinase [Rhodothermales bacterium]